VGKKSSNFRNHKIEKTNPNHYKEIWAQFIENFTHFGARFMEIHYNEFVMRNVEIS
jgi:hypothetical protein